MGGSPPHIIVDGPLIWCYNNHMKLDTLYTNPSPDHLLIVSESITDLEMHNEPISLWEMANLSSQATGINNIIVWVNGGGDKLKHGPRIKVYRGTKVQDGQSSTIPLTGTPRVIGKANINQEEFSQIVKWMMLNHDALIEYSNNQLTTDQLFAKLQKI